MHKCTNVVATIVFVAIIVILWIGWIVPYRITEEVIYRRQITENYPFAGDLVVDGDRIGASTELCTRFWLGHEDSIRVERFDCLFVTRRYPVTSPELNKVEQQRF